MKKLSLFLTLLAVALFAQAQTIQQTYHFSQPIVSEHDGYHQIGLKGCLPLGQIGEPMLPWQSVSLMLPQGQEATSINVEYFDFVELEGSYNLYPYQRPRPVSNEKEIPFAKNEVIYRSGNVYPIFVQTFIAKSRFATDDEICEYMNRIGFRQMNKDGYFENDMYILSDIKPKNVLCLDGDMYVIDAEITRK